MSARVRAPAALVLVIVSGCTILNAPDDDFLDGSTRFDGAPPVDGGADADTGMLDAGDDAGPPARETHCDDGLDDDRDGPIDCADFDCAAAETCCSSERPPTTEERWEDLVGWSRIPSSMPPAIRTGSGEINDFGAGTTPRGVVREQCAPMVNGFELRGVLNPVAPCSSGTECYAALVLSTVDDMAFMSHMSDELAVRMVLTAAGPELRITKAVESDPPLVVHPLSASTPITIVIEVGPTLNEEGLPALAATVKVLDEDLTPTTLLDAHPFITQDRLNRTDGDCAVNPGLFIAVEGVGDGLSRGVRVGALSMTERACANPGHFRRPTAESAILTSDRAAAGYASLRFDAWASGGIAHPAIASTLDAPMTSRWDVLVDATDVERTQDVGIWDLGFAVGHTYAVGTSWDSGWVDTDAPRLGDCHPSCVGSSGCPSMCMAGRRGYREPAIYPLVSGSGRISSLRLAYAIEDTTEPSRPFSIGIDPGVVATPSTPIEDPPVRIEPSTVMCDSLREPSLVPGDGGTIPDSWWLFYTCEKEGESPVIAALELDTGFMPVPGSHRTVLSGGLLGPLASAGVRSPEVLVSFSVREGMPFAFFRVWATAIQGSTRRIVLATAETMGALPVETDMVPYPDNPVLTLEDMPPCPADWCELLGMAVARRADKVDTLRFLVAWHVNGASTGREYQLVPLEQIWK